MKAHYLWWFLVCGWAVSVWGQGQDVVLELERADALTGQWVAVPMEAGMLSGGKLYAGKATNEAGFWRLKGQLVEAPTPTPTPTPPPLPPPVLPVFNGLTVDGGRQSAWFGTAWIDGFVITRYEVTGAQWDAVRRWGATNGYDIGAGAAAGDGFPITGVSWYDVVKWCNALSEWSGFDAPYQVNGAVFRSGVSNAVVFAGGAGWRLPTEREWEWAARGGTKSGNFTYAGSNDVNAVAWYDGNSASAKAVGLKATNELGLNDMSGNVAEWCFDAATVNWPPRRVRGGGFGTLGELSVRSTRRAEQSPESAQAWLGFRIAKFQ